MQMSPAATRTDMCEQGSTVSVLCERPTSAHQSIAPEIVLGAMGVAVLALLAILVMRRFGRRKEVHPPKQ